MVLLTSSQVSVAVSSAVVVSFTSALFLSGYAIQQRTVRNLRAAIRPDPSPQVYLPDRFRDATTELEDGTIVMLDEYNRPVRLKAGRISIGKPEEGFVVAAAANSLDDDSQRLGGQDAVQITVQQTLPEELQRQEQKVLVVEELAVPQEVMPEEDGATQESSPSQPVEPDPVPASPPLAPWEVRGEDASEGSEDEPGEDGVKPMSRAERRRKIKEDIQKLSQGETPLYYQRRLW